MTSTKTAPLEGDQEREKEPEGDRLIEDPTLLQRVFDRATKTGAGALNPHGEVIPRKRITFEVRADDCSPGLFEAGTSFKITLAALSSSVEVKALRGCQDPTEIVYMMARASIDKLNGAPVVGDQLDFLWEALGPAVRQLVVAMYQQIGSVSPVGLGKAFSSSTRS